ncbi:MAG: hypothetical protein ACLGXA_10640 [Acidobacteriota bacterium]
MAIVTPQFVGLDEGALSGLAGSVDQDGWGIGERVSERSGKVTAEHLSIIA